MDENITQNQSVPQAPQGAFAFFGSYSHSLDAKGRIIIPNAYRSALGEVFTIGPTRDFEGVALYPDSIYDRILAELTAMNQRKPFVQKYVMQFFKFSYRDIQPDAQGRVLLPPKLRTRFLENAKDLEISGICDHVRIVDAVKAEADDEDFSVNLNSILEEMGNMESPF